MPKFKLTGPDGSSYVVDAPDERSALDAFTRMQGGGAPPAAPSSSVPGMIESAGRGFADMASFGLDDEIAAGLRTGFGFTGDYSADVAGARSRKKAAQEANPGSFLAGQVVGAIPSMVIPGTNIVRGAALGAKIGRGMASGAALGGAYGVGSGEGGVMPRVVSGLEGSVVGGLAGGVVPALGAGVGRVAGGMKMKGAPAMAGRALTDDGLTADTARARLAELGPDAMIADLGPNLQRQAGALASVPGRAQETVRTAIGDRARGANARIQSDLDATIGPAPIPSRVDAEIVAGQRALRPEYEAALQGASAVDTSPIALALESEAVNLRGPAQAAVRSVRDMLNVTGTNVLDPNPATLLQTRQAIDGMISGQTDRNVIRVLSEVRKRVDEELTNAVPGIKAVDAKYAELARQREALERGQTVLDSGRTAPRPAELADEVAAAAQPRGEMVGPSAVPLRLSQGARAEIDRIVGTNTNDVVALNRLIKGEGSWNRDRLATLFGPERADRIIRVLDREKQFADTANTVTRNSETAARQAAQREVAPDVRGVDPGALESFGNLNFGSAVRRGVNFFTGGRAAEKQALRNEDLARVLTMGGGPRNTDPVVDELARALIARTRSENAEQAFNRLATPVGRASVPLGMDYADRFVGFNSFRR